MKVLVNAVSAKSGGAATYLQNLIPTLAQGPSEIQYLFVVPPAVAAAVGCGTINPSWRMAAAIGSRTTNPSWRVAAKLRMPLPNITLREVDVGYRSGFRRLLWDQWTLRELVKKEEVDLLVSSSDFGMLFPPCRQILLVRNPLFFSGIYAREILPRKSIRFRLEFVFRKWLVLLSILHSDRVVFASRSMLEDVRKAAGGSLARWTLNPFGVPLEKFASTGDSTSQRQGHPFRLLYVSEYSDYKNLTTLLRALLRLKEKGLTDFLLKTTAHPDQFPDVEIATRREDKTLACDPRISPHLRKAGCVDYNGIERLYWESDLFVFPSLAESFGHPLVEAMASGLPIVASDIPLCREICGEGALYFNPLDAEDLTEKILLLFRDPTLRQQMGQANKKRAQAQFDWKEHVRRFIQVVRAVGPQGSFCYEREREYYSRHWPHTPRPHAHLERYLRGWLDPVAVFGGKRILDIGAGECAYTQLIGERFGPQRVFACDLFPERMQPTFRAHTNGHVKFTAGDCIRLPFRDDTFDVVFGSLVLHQLPDLRAAVQEIHRVLSKDGLYVGIEPNPSHPTVLFRYFFRNHSPNQYLLGPRHLRSFERAGFGLTLRYFYAKAPFLRGRMLGTCMGIIAKKDA